MGVGGDIPKDVAGTSFAELFLTGEGDRPTSALYGRPLYNHPDMGERGVRTGRYTLTITQVPEKPTKIVLHDNKVDRFQLRNIAEDRPELVAQLIKDELLPWLKKAGDPWRPL